MNRIPSAIPLCRQEDSLLLIVDVQPKLVGAMPENIRTQALGQAGRLLQATTLLEIPVLATEQYPQGLGHLAPELRERLPETARVFDKTCFSCCGVPGLMQTVEQSNRRQMVIAGMETHVCVLQTAFELQDRDLEVFVAEDACASRRQANADNAAHRLRQRGITVTNAESVLFEWMRDAGHAHFKTVSRLLR